MSLEIENRCSGRDNLSNQNFIRFWEERGLTCENNYRNILFDLPNNTPNPNNVGRIQGDLLDFYNRYRQAGYDIVPPGSPGYNSSIQNRILSICQNLPTACDTFLNNYCADKSRETVASDRTFLGFCGCFVPTLDLTLIGTPECDPLCIQSDIKRGDPTTVRYITCNNNNLCIISRVSITAAKEVLNSNQVTFSQVCPTCSSQGSCACVFSDVNVQGLRDIGINSRGLLNQNCTRSVCYRSLPNGVLDQISCDSYLFETAQTPETPIETSNSIYWIVGIGIFIIIILIVILFFII